MENASEEPKDKVEHLRAVHQCTVCGATLDRESITEEEMITGVLACRACGHSGPLKLVVVTCL